LAGVLLTGALGELLFPTVSATFRLGYGWVTTPLLIVATGLLLYLPIGVTQGLVLQRMIPDFDHEALRRWARTTTLAGGGAIVWSALIYGLYLLLSLSLLDHSGIPAVIVWGFGLSYLVLTGVGIGLVLGLSQRILLGRYVLAPERWLQTTLLAWGLVLPLALLLGAWILPNLALITSVALLALMPGLHLSTVILFTSVITLPAAVTGLALPRLMTAPVRRPSGPDLPRLFPQ
jgi:hypothetical protein